VAWMASVGAEWDERLARLQGYVRDNLNVP